MAWVDLSYKDFSFEESPVHIGWLQLFLVKQLKSLNTSEDWIKAFEDELEVNATVDSYKYIFGDNDLDTDEKQQWAINFLMQCLLVVELMLHEQFSNYIGDDILNETNLLRIKRILGNYILMIKGYSPTL